MNPPAQSHFVDRLAAAIAQRRTAAIIGLDPVLERLPAELRDGVHDTRGAAAALERFGQAVIDIAGPRVPAIKINSAFFEAYHEFGVAAFYRLIEYAHATGLLVVADVKRGDIGSTARLYAAGHLADPRFAELPAARMPDAVTLAGYLGRGSVEPFIDAARATGRGVYVLVRPSDPSADQVHEFGGAAAFYEHMAALVRGWGAEPRLIGACGLSCVGAVVAPKSPDSTARLRAVLPQTPWLVPGYGAQGAGADACRACFGATPGSAVVNASRSVIYAYESAALRERHGDDWRTCLASAADALAADVACLMPGGPLSPRPA